MQDLPSMTINANRCLYSIDCKLFRWIHWIPCSLFIWNYICQKPSNFAHCTWVLLIFMYSYLHKYQIWHLGLAYPVTKTIKSGRCCVHLDCLNVTLHYLNSIHSLFGFLVLMMSAQITKTLQPCLFWNTHSLIHVLLWKVFCKPD